MAELKRVAGISMIFAVALALLAIITGSLLWFRTPVLILRDERLVGMAPRKASACTSH